MSEPTGTGADTLDTLQTEVTPSITSALTETSADPSRTLTTGVTLDVDQDPFSDSATPLKGRNRGFPVMPAENNMRGMLNKPARRGPDRMRPRGGPSITEWEAVLLGKQLVAEDAEDSEDVSVFFASKISLTI